MRFVVGLEVAHGASFGGGLGRSGVAGVQGEAGDMRTRSLGSLGKALLM